MPALLEREPVQKLLTVLVFTGIFLPVRLLFYTFVSQYWLGSFGLISGILITLVYFSQKGKLGYLGVIILRHTMRFAKGKVGFFFMASSIFLLYFFTNVIYGIESAPEPVKHTITDELQKQGITNLQDVTMNAPRARLAPEETLLGLLVLFIPSQVGYATYGIINDMSDGWLLHFATVFLIEQIEICGLVIYFRYFKRINNSNTITP